MNLKWTMEHKAYVAREWVSGLSQQTIGERYGYSYGMICNRINEFVISVFPAKAIKGSFSYGPIRMRYDVGGNHARREFTKKALEVWGGCPVEPPYHRGEGPLDIWPEFVLPLDNTPDIAA